MPQNGVASCVHFCLRSLVPFERCGLDNLWSNPFHIDNLLQPVLLFVVSLWAKQITVGIGKDMKKILSQLWTPKNCVWFILLYLEYHSSFTKLSNVWDVVGYIYHLSITSIFVHPWPAKIEHFLLHVQLRCIVQQYLLLNNTVLPSSLY